MNQLEEYTRINNSFNKTLIYHVGVGGGFHSEVDAMMQCMLYCYMNQIKFTLYADDANFSGGHGWEEFFKPFCLENHSWWNRIGNPRATIPWYRIDQVICSRILRWQTKADYLTGDIFDVCIPRSYSMHTHCKWDLFGIDGTNLQEFAKLRTIALAYNEQTAVEVQARIDALHLPDDYVSIQMRGGDIILEVSQRETAEDVVDAIDRKGVPITNLFILTDDYRYVEDVQRLRPDWTIYTLTGTEERSYYNKDFNTTPWTEKRAQMIKLFAMIDICLQSSLHLGYADSCINNYIHSVKGQGEGYIELLDRNIQ